jgi:hypothetical protein
MTSLHSRFVLSLVRNKGLVRAIELPRITAEAAHARPFTAD